MNKHTPGPWIGFNNGFKIWVKSEDNLKRVGEFVADLTAQADKEKAWADARLIAAAPELLEACRRVFYSLDGHLVGSLEQGLSNLCKAAIAKAEGK